MTNSILVLMSLIVGNGLAVENLQRQGLSLAGQDLHVVAPVITTCEDPMPGWSHVMLLDNGASVQIGDNLLTGRSAVVWLQGYGQTLTGPDKGQTYLSRVYLEGDVSIQKGAKSRATPVQHFTVEGAEVLLTQFKVTGEVFASTDSQKQITAEYLSDFDIYDRAVRAAGQIPSGPSIPASAMVPNVEDVVTRPRTRPSDKELSPADAAIVQQLQQALPDQQQPEEPPAMPEYPMHVSAMWEPVPEIHSSRMPDGQEVYTASGRFYVWHKLSEEQVIEFMADNMVIFTEPGAFSVEQETGNQIGSGNAQSVYFSGNIVMTEGDRTTRADEVYYDFAKQRALVINATMRMFDQERGLPIYLRAKKLGRVSKDIFEATDVQLTSSEFYFPQISMNSSKMVLLSGEALEQHYRLSEKDKETPDYEAHLVGVDAKYGKYTFFKWPRIVTDFERPDTALSRLQVGDSSRHGTMVETRWHLARLLGLKEPDWMESQLLLDYYSKRGVGVGAEANYEKEDAIGSIIGYVINDDGEDRLSRTRKNVAADEDLRGRFSFRHRQYLPEDWQLTTEVSYITDRNFMESFYRSEFYNDKGQETLVYLKRIRDNWGFSILGKIRINDFETMTEEMPSIEYHVAGQSFWNHRLTFYSDNQIARFREKFDEAATPGPQDTSDYYYYGFTRNEVDLPLMWRTVKFVPYVAGSYAYEDNYGFQRDLSYNQVPGDEDVILGEVGLRASTMFWKDDPFLRSDLWDLNGMRHIITPYAEAVMYEASDDTIDMRDTVHLGVLQRWQTHRGSEQQQRSLDWMRLDIEGTWVTDDADDAESIIDPITQRQLYGPAAFIYNDASIPFLHRRNNSYFGLVRDTITGEYMWRVSDTLSVLSDVNLDIEDADLQQFNIGVSRFVYPDLSYYVGTRYLKPIVTAIDEDGDGIFEDFQEGSNSFVAAVTYRLSPRYTATFSQEYNFEFGEVIQSELTIIRQYHRLFYALSFGIDESLDDSSIMLSIWPQGVRELAIGSRDHVGLTGSRWED